MSCKYGKYIVGPKKGKCRTKMEALADAKSFARLIKRAGLETRAGAMKRIRKDFGLSDREAQSVVNPYFGKQ